MTDSATNRTPLWDNVRFFLIVLVVVGHFTNTEGIGVYQSIFIFAYSFHMPLFFFVAGLFHKNDRIPQKAVSYLALYVFFKLSVYVLKHLFGKHTPLNLLKAEAAPWFMLVMAYFTVLTYLLRNANKFTVIAAAVILGILAGYPAFLGDSFLALMRMFVFFPFYYLGYVSDRSRLEALASNRKLKFAGAFVLLIWAIVCLLYIKQIRPIRGVLTGRKLYEETVLGALAPLYRVLNYLMSALFGFCAILATPVRSLPIVTKWGSRTLQIYYWHRMFLYFFELAGVQKLFLRSDSLKLLWIAVAICVCVLCGFRAFAYPTKLAIMLQKGKNKN